MALFWKLEEGLLMLILVGMIGLSFLQIVLRNLLGLGLVWIEPLVRQMLLWLALLGAVVAARNHNHITVDAVARFLPLGRVKFAAGFFCDAFAMVVCGLLAYSTLLVFQMEYQNPQGGTIIPGLPLWGTLLILPIAFGIMTLRFVRSSILSLVHLIRGKGKP